MKIKKLILETVLLELIEENIRNVVVGIAMIRADVMYPMKPTKFAKIIIIIQNKKLRDNKHKTRSAFCKDKRKQKITHIDKPVNFIRFIELKSLNFSTPTEV